MKSVKTAGHQLKKVARTTKRRALKLSKSSYAHDRKVWAAVAVVIVAVVFWLLPTFAAAAPGQLGYAIKRGEETLLSNLAPLPSWRDSLRLDFANNRVSEAAYVADRANEVGNKDQARTAATISSLLDTYENAYQIRTASLNQQLDSSKKPAKSAATGARKAAVRTYATLELLRLQAPPSAQLAVLTAIDDTQQNIAALNDALAQVPLSASDFSQLARLVTFGIISQADVNNLAKVTSSRQLHATLVTMINNGTLPADITYDLDYDLVKQVVPAKSAAFQTEAQFEEMQRISAVLTASRPTDAQKQAIQSFLGSYKAGTQVPAGDIQPYVAPIIYGMALSGQLQGNLLSLSSIRMNSDDQALFDSWKGVLDPPNLADTYQTLMTDAQSQPDLHLRNLVQAQAELTAAQKAQVTYLVMPPGWNINGLAMLDKQMGIEIAETSFSKANPNANQELATIAASQGPLQSELNNLQTIYSSTISKLQTQINSFQGTPDQLAELKQALADLTQNQMTTINDLQTQLTNVTTTHTRLGDAITNLKQEQQTNLTELELRAAATAKGLSDATKAQLNTLTLDHQVVKNSVSELQAITQDSQSLISGLQSQVDRVGSGQDQLRSQLTGEIHTIKTNYQQLKDSVQTQLDSGTTTSAQLQTALALVQAGLANAKTTLASVGSSHDALSQLVDQVKSDSQTGLQALQVQLGTVQLSQQTIHNAVDGLQAVTQASQSLISGLQTQVSGLSSSQTQLREELTADIQTIQSDYTALIGGLQGRIDAGVATTTDLTASLQTTQANLAAQAAELGSLGSNHDALATLVGHIQSTANAQVADLQDQISSLRIDQQGIKTSLDSLTAKQATDLADLTSQLASLHVVQVEAQADIANLIEAQTSAQASISNLSANFDTLQTTLNGSLAVQASLQADLADQQSVLDSLTTQIQSGLDTLTAQQVAMDAQLTNLAANGSNLNQTVNAVQASSTSTQTQLTTLLASAPWAIPSGTYVTQNDFNSLSAQLNTQFAQKAAQLDAQFQAYQETLNATVNQLTTQVNSLSSTVSNTQNQITSLTTTVTNNKNSQQSQIDSLNSQLQTLQQQLNQLLHPAGL